MKFKNLTTDTCPDCGCGDITREEFKIYIGHDGRREINQHCNGEKWETRTFLCGKTIEWVPNFSREFDVNKCTWTFEYIRQQEKIKAMDAEIKRLQGERWDFMLKIGK